MLNPETDQIIDQIKPALKLAEISRYKSAGLNSLGGVIKNIRESKEANGVFLTFELVPYLNQPPLILVGAGENAILDRKKLAKPFDDLAQIVLSASDSQLKVGIPDEGSVKEKMKIYRVDKTQADGAKIGLIPEGEYNINDSFLQTNLNFTDNFQSLVMVWSGMPFLSIRTGKMNVDGTEEKLNAILIFFPDIIKSINFPELDTVQSHL